MVVGEGDEDGTVAEHSKESAAMAPWEQHSAVISMPRFDYNAPSSLLQRSHSGFLITCTIKREKSATKEAISILEKHVGSINCCSSEALECTHANRAAKRRKTCERPDITSSAEGNSAAANSKDVVEIDGELANGVDGSATSNDSGNPADELSKGTCLHPSKTDLTTGRDDSLSLVKLTRSGLVLFIFPRDNAPDTVNVLLNIMKSQQSGSLKAPLWCHRIFPIQATCNLNEEELHSTVRQLVLHFANERCNRLAEFVKFAVGYNRRGVEETEMKYMKKKLAKNSDLFPLLDRQKCFSVVAAAIKDVVPNSVVDLRTPDLSVLVELLPLSGVPNGSLVVAVSVLPHNLVSTKPRLCVKALISDAKGKK